MYGCCSLMLVLGNGLSIIRSKIEKKHPTLNLELPFEKAEVNYKLEKRHELLSDMNSYNKLGKHAITLADRKNRIPSVLNGLQ